MKITKNRGVVEDEVENLQLMKPAEPALKGAINKKMTFFLIMKFHAKYLQSGNYR